MKYALVGGWGYVGANLSDYLDSCVIARKSSVERRPFLEYAFEGKEVIVVNEFNEEELRSALERCKADVLVYVAGKIKGTYEEMKEAHVDKAVLAYEISERLGIRYVYISSVAAMGLADRCKVGGVVMEEDELLKGCEPVGSYSTTKAEGELTLFDKSRGRVGIVRPALVKGRYAYHVEWKWLRMAKKLRIPVPNVSVTTIPCLVQGIETAAERPGWYIAVDTSLGEIGLKTFDLKPPKALIRALPDPWNVSLLSLRYKYASKYLPC